VEQKCKYGNLKNSKRYKTRELLKVRTATSHLRTFWRLCFQLERLSISIKPQVVRAFMVMANGLSTCLTWLPGISFQYYLHITSKNLVGFCFGKTHVFFILSYPTIRILYTFSLKKNLLISTRNQLIWDEKILILVIIYNVPGMKHATPFLWNPFNIEV
jgi:hypothetical protein